MIRLMAAGVLLGLASCARNGAESKPADQSSQSATSAPVITLERTACFGSCPVYTISVTASGDVQYEGRAHVRKMGAATGRVPQELVDALLSELNRGGYFTFAERYTSPEPTCGRYVTDSPTVITSVTLGGRTKRIAHDYGCGGAPGALVVLEHRIDEALSSDQWTGR
ncbi:MAG: hypothetical protein QOK27_1740 [Gemmatimonadales bacterium]|nr:hypothetical protein [Gemmatimonadales bacterium]